MKQQIFYIHGGAAYRKYEDYLKHLKTTPIEPHSENTKRWTDSLAEDLGDRYEVFKPTMPNKYNSKYDEWKIWFERHFEFLHDEVVLIGWSQGGIFLTKYLLENDPPFTIRALILLAAPYETFVTGGEDGGDFGYDTQQLPKLAEIVNKVALFHSKDDFVVPYDHALKFQAALPKAELFTFEDKNHFLVAELPELLEYIQNL